MFISNLDCTEEECINKLKEFDCLFPNYFLAAKNLMESKNVDSDYLWDKFKFGIFDTNSELLFPSYAYLGYMEILESINRDAFKKLSGNDIEFIWMVLRDWEFSVNGIYQTYSKIPDMTYYKDLSDIMLVADGLGRKIDHWIEAKPFMKQVELEADQEAYDKYLKMEAEERDAFYSNSDYQYLSKWIDVIRNDYEELEKETISVIVNSHRKEEKISVIQKYIRTTENKRKGSYPYKNETIDLDKCRKTMEEEFDRFGSYYWSERDIKKFFDSISYNYLLILFHRVRLEYHEKYEALLLGRTVGFLKNNIYDDLNPNVKAPYEYVKGKNYPDNIVRLITCYNIIVGYFEQNKDVIRSCNKKEDTVETQYFIKTLHDEWAEDDEVFDKSKSFVYEIERNKLLLSNAKDDEKEIIKEETERLNEQVEVIKTEVHGEEAIERLRMSHNIIFLLVNIIDLKLDHCETSEEDVLLRMKDQLLEIDLILKNELFSNPTLLNKYRQSDIFNSRKLERGERDEEERYLDQQHENTLNQKESYIQLVSSILNGLLDSLEKDNMSTEDIMNYRNRIISDARLNGDSDEEIEMIAERISNILEKRFVGESEFESYKVKVEQELGRDKYLRIPEQAQKSLATADYLYDLYINTMYHMDFDYSCISVLYYQAFEATYNKLIYGPFASYLNTCKARNRSFHFEDAFPYQYAIKYENQRTRDRLKLSCEYGNFAVLLNKVHHSCDRENEMFYQFFVEQLGGRWNNHDMREFIDGLFDAKGRRNKASHGGQRISRDELMCDKAIILNDSDLQGRINEIVQYRKLLKMLLEML